MNDRDKELAKQTWTENDWDRYLYVPKLIDLIRADEREACAKWLDFYDGPNGRRAEAIRARGKL